MSEKVFVEPGWKLPAIDADLKLIAGFTIVTMASIYLPVVNETPLRSILGLIMALFIPGYSLIAALFPGKTDLGGIERAGLSVGLSIFVTPLIGLGLNFTQWGIRLGPLVVCLAVVSLGCCAAANIRRHRVNPADRFCVDLTHIYKKSTAVLFQGDQDRLDRVLSLFILLCIIASVATLAFVIMTPKTGEKFTQFYILGPDGKADNYPANLHLGDSKPVIVGITNNEYRDVTYDLVVALNDNSGVSQLYADRFTLANNQTLEKPVTLAPDRAGTNLKIEFLLYTDGNMSAPYRELHLWTNVTG